MGDKFKTTEHHEIKLKVTIILLLLFLIPATYCLKGQDQVPADQVITVFQGETNSNRWINFSDSRNSLYRYFASQAIPMLDKRSEEISNISDLDGWMRRQSEIRTVLTNIIGPFPEKTPLNPKILKVLEKELFRVENIIFESQPGYYVTSSLFIPDGLKEKAPAVVYVPGHTENYRDSAYQLIILNLVKRGFIVYAFDPVSLGERVQYFDRELGKSSVGIATSEHSYAGAQSLLTGISQAGNMIWDGIRAVDYLCTREEVDLSRIGMVGSSGGGTQTAYMSAFDERIYAAIPSNYITNLKRLLQSIGPQDAEQNIYGSVSNGMDHADFVTVRAPKPTLILSSTRDFFSIQGTFESVEEISEVYRAYDRPGNFQFFYDDVNHSVTKEKREKMYSFFQEHLSMPGSPDEMSITPLTHEELQVTSTGQVATSLMGENIFSVNKKEADRQDARLSLLRKNPESHIPEAVSSAKKLSGYEKPSSDFRPVFTGRTNFDDHAVEKYFLEQEGNIPLPYLLILPGSPSGKAVIYIHPEGKNSYFTENNEIKTLINKGITVLLPDLSGIGEIGPAVRREFTHRTELFAYSMLSKSVTGVQSADVVKLTKVMNNLPGINEVYGIASGYLSAVLLHAAAFEPVFKGILLNNPCLSYYSIATTRIYHPEFTGSIVPYALTKYDLPDLAASLAPLKLIMADVVDGADEKTGIDDSVPEIRFVKSVYSKAGAADRVQFLHKDGSNLTSSVFDRLFN